MTSRARDTQDPNRIGGGRALERTTAKLTPEVQEQITSVIRAGNYIETAAAYAGVHRDTLYTWLRKGRDATEGPYHDFAQAVELALAQAEVRDLALIGRAAEEVWQAAAWRLERRYPDKYGRRQRIDHSNAEGAPFMVAPTPVFDPSKLTSEELDTAISLLRKAQPDGARSRPELPRAVEG